MSYQPMRQLKPGTQRVLEIAMTNQTTVCRALAAHAICWLADWLFISEHERRHWQPPMKMCLLLQMTVPSREGWVRTLYVKMLNLKMYVFTSNYFLRESFTFTWHWETTNAYLKIQDSRFLLSLAQQHSGRNIKGSEIWLLLAKVQITVYN